MSDAINIFQWWATIFTIGIIFLPLTISLFSNFFDKGYIFSKTLGIAVLSYSVFVLGVLKILPFTFPSILLILLIFLSINLLLTSKYPSILISIKHKWRIFIFEEIVFFLALLAWVFVRAHQPDIHGLEKFMDFGFINSILRSDYFPPKDMWFTPLYINYYYFGHLVTAVLTKTSNIPSSITFNLMIAAIFALTFSSSFSIGLNLFKNLNTKYKKASLVIVGFLTALLVSLSGSLHSVYTLFKPYTNESPIPFWKLLFSLQTFPNNYWYPNATRFIHNTIHEFPLYSFVVSDLHGHVLDIPFVLLTIAVLFSLIQNAKFKMQNYNSKFKILNFEFPLLTFNFSLLTLLAFLLAIMYMTNAWDGVIYFLLAFFVFLYINVKHKLFEISRFILYIILLGGSFFLFSFPFNLFFKPFANNIGILCAPQALINIGRLGPFIFEANHCQHSPFWQLLILYGFFYFWAISFILFLFKKLYATLRLRSGRERYRLNASDIFVLLLLFLSTLLIIIPEFIYIKDIYPAHYRANTMFKLVYQAFIMLSISSAYIITRLIYYWKLPIAIGIGSICLLIVFLYPYFAINSYYGDLKKYYGLDGTLYLAALYPNDYQAILWINKNIKKQPVILEAQGDSYTDYARISVNTGLPTVLGWTVHEWLWRGTYDVPSPRIAEVTKMYESKDIEETKILLKKYKVSLVFLGDLEKQKYPNLNEEKFSKLGKIIYQNGQTKIYKIN